MDIVKLSIVFFKPAARYAVLELSIADLKKRSYEEVIALEIEFDAYHQVVAHTLDQFHAVLLFRIAPDVVGACKYQRYVWYLRYTIGMALFDVYTKTF